MKSDEYATTLAGRTNYFLFPVALALPVVSTHIKIKIDRQNTITDLIYLHWCRTISFPWCNPFDTLPRQCIRSVHTLSQYVMHVTINAVCIACVLMWFIHVGKREFPDVSKQACGPSAFYIDKERLLVNAFLCKNEQVFHIQLTFINVE